MTITVRMYCHGFGDCFLLKFQNHPDETPFLILIDCGMLTGKSELMLDVVKSIGEDSNWKLDVVVQTHEHKDHVSGFNLKERGKLIWDKFEVNQVWQAWTEDP